MCLLITRINQAGEKGRCDDDDNDEDDAGGGAAGTPLWDGTKISVTEREGREGRG